MPFFRSIYKLVFLFSTGMLLSLLTSCASYQVNPSSNIRLEPDAVVAILDFNNNTQTPQANEAAASITANILRAKGFSQLVIYQPSKQNTIIPGLESPPPIAEQLQWAKEHHAQYALMGSVNEWQYKVGLDGEPVIGLTLQVTDLEQNKIIWSSVGSMHGTGRQALAVSGQNLINNMLASVMLWQ